MFEFLKKKIESVISKVSEGVTKKVVEKASGKEKLGKKAKITESVFQKIFEREISTKDLDILFGDLEIGLLEADVAVEVIDKIKEDLKKTLIGKRVKKSEVKKIILQSFKNTILEVLDVPKKNLEDVIKRKRPALFVFLGFNGSGKTTTIAKVGYYLKKKGYSCVFAAGDSFRAASLEQLEEHGNKIGIRVIKHKYGADAAAVIFDGVKHAEAEKIDVVLADTAGRTHVNKNLMDELKKICRVNKPDLKILVIDSLTGNDAVPQAKMFDEAVGTDGIFFTKVDVNEKGGAILSVCQTIKKPIFGLGIGQKYDDLVEFDRKKFVDNLLC